MTKSNSVGPMDDPVHLVDIENSRLSDLDVKPVRVNTEKDRLSNLDMKNVVRNYEIKPDCSSLNFLHKNDPYYNIPGLKNEIHHTVWRCLSREEQAGIINSFQTVRPEKVSRALWEELSDDQKIKINDSINRVEEKSGMKKIVERPDEIAPDIWDHLEIETQNEIFDKVNLIRPKGFDEELWNRLDGNCHETINKAMNEAQSSVASLDAKEKPTTYGRNYWTRRMQKSRIVAFFTSANHIVDDPDAGIGALSLVCALILTIPYGILQFLTSDFFNALHAQMLTCKDEKALNGFVYSQVFDRMITSLVASIFGSMMGLILSSFYYIFQPLAGKDIEKW
eukprot:CAMPEP_0119042606 /NCGR_PEP_ID=MMETSP1177-20130426/16017_1 /TAXON_ID=2985 /ORGANISM="Ochromonas sp, Strain CCMP1899" /LENGTH=336 /DNA_ID=CAMNT_0007009519 /DNA_START=191 /DNA_END=1198 /DNA_ORIENTATION=+